jgi:putative cell wall-binding protein
MPYRARRSAIAAAAALTALLGTSLVLPLSAAAVTDVVEPAAEAPAPPLPYLLSPYGGAPLYQGQKLAGALPRGGTEYTVQIAFDGGPRTEVPVQITGYFELDVSGLALGQHPYAMRSSTAGGTVLSADVTGTLSVVAKPVIERIGGPDRYAVAVAVADREFPGDATAPVVYIATGANYPDALSAGPAAVQEGGPLLLVTPEGIPEAVASTIRRLQPERIVIAGGPASVSPAIEAQLGDLIEGVTVERRTGADRYEASRAVIAGAFDEAAEAYVATGENFPDALSAGPAAALVDGPVALINGTKPPVDPLTIELLNTLGVSVLTAVGGRESIVPDQIVYLGGVTANVTRIDGVDRYDASLNLNTSAFESSKTAYLATGYSFPDALTGGVLAAMEDAPLFVVPGGCFPAGTLIEFERLGVERLVLLGGPESIGDSTAELTACIANP